MDIHTVTLNTIKVVRQSFQDRGDKGFNEFVDDSGQRRQRFQ